VKLEINAQTHHFRGYKINQRREIESGRGEVFLGMAAEQRSEGSRRSYGKFRNEHFRGSSKYRQPEYIWCKEQRGLCS
jgi:hypothetical protein